MPMNHSTRFYYGFVTEVSGDPTADRLAYKYIAFDQRDQTRSITGGPTKPRRPFTQAVEISKPLEIGSAIMVVEHMGESALILIDQEVYATEECT